MASKELTVSKGNTSVAMYVDPSKVDYSVRSRWLSSQGTGGGRVFAGRQLRFNGQKGRYTEYANRKDVRIKKPLFVVNVPNTLAAWEYWPEGEAPTYPHVIAPFSDPDAVLPSRAQCGPEEWKMFKKDRQDVWGEAVVLILRNPETDQIYHWVCKASARWAVTDFLNEVLDECAKRPGKLPVVELVALDAEGKDGETYMKPGFEIVEWVKATAMDNPKGLASAVESSEDDEDEDDDDNLKSKAKVKARSASKKHAAKVEDEDEDDEDEDEDDDDDDADTTKLAVKKRKERQASLSKKHAAKVADEDDDDDDDEEEEELPKSKKGKKAPVSKRKVAPIEDDDADDDEDDDEEAEEKPRGRRGRRGH